MKERYRIRHSLDLIIVFLLWERNRHEVLINQSEEFVLGFFL